MPSRKKTVGMNAFWKGNTLYEWDYKAQKWVKAKMGKYEDSGLIL